MSTTPVLHESALPEALTEDQWTGLERTAKRLVRLSWIPAAYKPSNDKSVEVAEAEIAAAGLALFSIGRPLTPMTLKLVYVVNGTVDFMYELISAQVHAHGHEIWVVDESPESATVAGQRRGSDRVHTVTYTMDDARRAGLTERWDKRQGKKVPTETYQKNPRDMLVARAGKRVAKRIAPEALMTMPPPINYVVTDSGRVQVAEIVHEDLDENEEIYDAEVVGEGPPAHMDPETGEVSGHATTAPPAPAPDVDRDEWAEFVRWREAGGPRDEQGKPIPVHEPGETTADAEGRDNAGAGPVVAAPAAPGPGPVPGEWRARAAELGFRDSTLLKEARKLAGTIGVDPPASLDEITDPRLVAAVEEWLG